jgi:GT2 family glycosyltransferase/SAM-dependent methyltransferase
MPPEVSVVIVTHNSAETIGPALDAVAAVGLDCQTIVVDNASQDDTVRVLRARGPGIEVRESESNLGFARACNLAAREAKADFLLFLNPDTRLGDGAVERAVDHLRSHPDVGVVGGHTRYPDGTTNATCCFGRPTLWSAVCNATGLSSFLRSSSLFNPEMLGGWDRADTRRVDVVTGCFLLIARSLFESLDGFDERFFLYSEDTDLCTRVRQVRLACVHLADAELVHLGGVSDHIRSEKIVKVYAARALYYNKHWSAPAAALGRQLLDVSVLVRLLVHTLRLDRTGQQRWRDVWAGRQRWRSGGGPMPGGTSPRPAGLVQLRPAPLVSRLRLVVRNVRHVVRSARAGWWDFVAQGLATLVRIPAFTLADLGGSRVHECNVCGWTGPRFYPNTGPGYHEQATGCPGCNSQDRHRSLLALLGTRTDFLAPGSRIVEVAPMHGFESLVRRQPGVDYTSFDLVRRAMEHGDLTAMRFETGSVDWFVCFHVLEHVPDEAAAVREIRRVLRPGGTAVLQVPVDWDRTETLEFGAPDPRDVGHVRTYGRTFPEVVAAYGLEVSALSVLDHFDAEQVARFGLSPEPIYLARRPVEPSA